jgi:hypothetical protein
MLRGLWVHRGAFESRSSVHYPLLLSFFSTVRFPSNEKMLVFLKWFFI